MNELRGMIVPIVTPLSSEGVLDAAALGRLCGIQVRAGTQVIFALGTTGEFYGLSLAQQGQVVETVVEAVAGRAAVIVGVSAHSTAMSVQALRECRRDGVTAYVSSTPYFMGYSQTELLDHFRLLSDAAKTPIILYNYPGRYRHRIDISTIRQLLEEGRVLAIKDTDGDFQYMLQLLELKQTFPSFLVFEGALPNLAKSGRLGIDGSVQALANLWPDECAALWQQILGRQWETLDASVARMWAFHRDMESVASFIRSLKACMALRQWCSPVPAPPMRAVGRESVQSLRELMDRDYPNWRQD
jgi:4-hydroxy-tetrahydrodipicolinate synthase